MSKYNVSIRDVAKLADVSVGTVSRYINHNPSVSDKNAKKIRDAIDKLKYVPNQTAQNLAKGISNNLILYIIQENPILTSTWLYELPIIQSIYDYLKNTDYSLQVAIDFVEDSERISKFINDCINNKRADGMIILSSWSINNSDIVKLFDSKFPFILIGNENMIQSSNEILFDNYDGIKQIVNYLYELGHRKIGFISGCRDQQHMAHRIRAYFDCLQELDIKINEEWVKYGDYSMESGYSGMWEILDLNVQPTAIVCGNDYIASGAIKAIGERGFSVPSDYSVTGFDDSIVSKVVEPNLTTVRVPLNNLADLAIEKLIHLINKDNDVIPREVLPCTMVIRSSTGNPKTLIK